MVRRLVALFCGLLVATQSLAGVNQFPYEAEVRADNAAVRCGQGKNYYVTTQLGKGTHVVVHRHDPGGWAMISPPEGSFSWIAADLVRVDGAGVGVVELPDGDTAGAPVWIGSDQGPEHSVRQRVLRSGDSVQILGEETLSGQKYLKIAPPLREFRWIKVDFLLPADPNLRQVALNDPFANPLESEINAAQIEASEPDLPVRSAPSLPAVTREAAATSASREALREIDRHYVDMVSQDPSQWDMEELIKSYQGLATSAPELAGQIQQRLAALEPRRKLIAEYRSLMQLSAETTAKDQELAAQAGDTAVASNLEIELGTPDQLSQPVQVASTADPILDSYVETPPGFPAGEQTTVQKLDGAGIVRRLPSGQYAITNATGRVLAVLQTDQGTNLEGYVGQSMGFVGRRQYDPRLGTDRIAVQRMMPVQLGGASR